MMAMKYPALFLAASSLCFTLGCSRTPKVVLTARHENALQHFDIATKVIHDITGFYVWSYSRQEPIWAVGRHISSDGNELPSRLVFGNIPREMKQYLPSPPSRHPRLPQGGELLILEVAYQYDDWFAACAGGSYHAFTVTDTGTWTPVSRPSDWLEVRHAIQKQREGSDNEQVGGAD